MLGLFADAEAHAQHLLFAWRERGQHLAGLLCQVHGNHSIGCRDDALVFDEIAKMRVTFHAHGRFQGDGLFGNVEHVAHFLK